MASSAYHTGSRPGSRESCATPYHRWWNDVVNAPPNTTSSTSHSSSVRTGSEAASTDAASTGAGAPARGAAAPAAGSSGSTSTRSTSQSRHRLKPSRYSSRQLGQNMSARRARRVQEYPDPGGQDAQHDGCGPPGLPVEQADEEAGHGGVSVEPVMGNLLKDHARRHRQRGAAGERPHLRDDVGAEHHSAADRVGEEAQQADR